MTNLEQRQRQRIKNQQRTLRNLQRAYNRVLLEQTRTMDKYLSTREDSIELLEVNTSLHQKIRHLTQALTVWENAAKRKEHANEKTDADKSRV